MFTCSKRLLHYNFLYQYLSRYSLVSLIYQCLNQDTIQLAIDINRNYRSQIKGDDPQPVYQNREPRKCNPCSINATTNRRDLVSYRYQSQASHNRSQIKGDDPQLVKQNWELHEFDPRSVNANITRRDLVSYRYQLKARNYQS